MAQKLSEEEIHKFITAIGDDINRPGLRNTSQLFLQTLGRYFSGYESKDLSSVITRLENPDEAESLLVLRKVSFLSFCEHHISPISGVISVGYIPDRSIASLGSLGRLINACTRRLQIQERICSQIASAIEESLSPKGVIVYASAQHSCLKHDVKTFDSVSKRGVFASNTKGEVQEFFSIIK